MKKPNLTPQEKPPEKNDQPKTVESDANFEGNYSLLLFSRIKNPFIQEQLVDLLYEGELAHAAHGQNIVVFDKQGKVVLTPEGEVLTERQPYIALSKKELRDAVYEKLKLTESDTPITYDTEAVPSVHQDRELMPIFSDIYKPKGAQLNPSANETRIKSIVEAHEKGHVIRNIKIFDTFLEEHFRKGFDIAKAEIPKEELEQRLKEEQFEEAAIHENFTTYLFCAGEIAERMSQLKGYFGFKGSEEFTKEHLDYARENYIKDTGIDNYMTAFFNAITPETEKDFLRLINTSGI